LWECLIHSSLPRPFSYLSIPLTHNLVNSQRHMALKENRKHTINKVTWEGERAKGMSNNKSEHFTWFCWTSFTRQPPSFANRGTTQFLGTDQRTDLSLTSKIFNFLVTRSLTKIYDKGKNNLGHRTIHHSLLTIQAPFPLKKNFHGQNIFQKLHC
jgi:hypothetical protein